MHDTPRHSRAWTGWIVGSGRIRRAVAAALIGLTAISCDESRDPAAANPSGPPAVVTGRVDDALAAAEQYLDGLDLSKAESILLSVVRKAPDESRGHEMLGRLRLIQAATARDRGDERAAAALFASCYESYESAARLSPDDAGLQHSAGEIAQVAGRRDEALAHYLRASSIDPSEARHLIFAAQVLMETDRLDEAATVLDRAVALGPDEPITHASMAMVSMRRGDRVSALEHIRRARSLAPDDLGIRVVEARVQRESGSPRRAIEMLAGLDRRERRSEAVTSELAASYVAIGENLAAARAWQEHCADHAADPAVWRAAIRAGHLLLQAGERAEAAAWLERARPSAPNSAEVAGLEAALAAPG